MTRTIFGAAFAAILLASTPSLAAKVSAASCSSADMAKAEAMVDAMPEGETKAMSYKELTGASQAVASGNMAECAKHMNNVTHMGMTKPGT